MNKIIVIVGPTGVGKTKLSIELAHQLNGEVINADSTQVYKGLCIATAKVKEHEKENVPHHLLDIKEITEDYSVYDYQQNARQKLDDILNRGKTAIIVGGTGLYIKALLYDYEFDKEENSLNLYEKDSTENLFKKLLVIDPKTNINSNNRQRIVRAINHYNNTGKIPSETVKAKPLYDFLTIGLTTDRKLLYERINNRVDEMIEEGLIQEAYQIYQTNIRSKAVMTPIGYKELFEYFDKKITKEQAIELIKKHSRNYAKRQYTWFNHQMPVNWFMVDFKDFSATVSDILNFIEKNSDKK